MGASTPLPSPPTRFRLLAVAGSVDKMLQRQAARGGLQDGKSARLEVPPCDKQEDHGRQFFPAEGRLIGW